MLTSQASYTRPRIPMALIRPPKKSKKTFCFSCNYPSNIHERCTTQPANPCCSLAGYETLGHTLRSVITHVASHRPVKCRLWSEISGTPVTTDIISSKHALTLPSLKATIRENLRYDPAICSHLPRFPSRSKSLEILGYVVPASVELACDVNPSTGAKRQLAVMRMCFDQRGILRMMMQSMESGHEQSKRGSSGSDMGGGGAWPRIGADGY